MTDTSSRQLAYERAYHVKSLTGLDSADPVEGRVVWDPLRSLWNAGMRQDRPWRVCSQQSLQSPRSLS